MKKIYNILIILITSISVFAQSPNTGIVPSSVNDRSRIDPSEQLRKSANPFEVLMTDANKKTMFWDTAHYKEILNLGRIDSLKQINDSTIVFYDRVNAVVDTVKIKVGAVDTDTRDSISFVNDSLKIEVWDKANNTLITTYYVDNVINEPTNIYTLTSVSDTATYSPLAQANCPALSVAKLDSCNVSYLFVFNCSNNSWEVFKTEAEYKDKLFVIAQKYKTFQDNNGVDNTTNPAFQTQLDRARIGCDHCPYPSIGYAVSDAVTKNLDSIMLEVSASTYNISGSSSNPVLGTFKSLGLKTNNSWLDVSSLNAPLYSINSDTYNSYNLDIDNLVGINCTHTPYPLFSSRHEGTGTLNLKIKNLIYEPTQSTRLFGAFLETKGNLNFEAENVRYKAGSFFLVSNGGEVNGRPISKTYHVKNLDIIDGNGLYMRRGQHDTKINAHFENVIATKTLSPPYISGTTIGYQNLIVKTNGGSFASYNGNNSSVYIRVNNYKRVDTFSRNYGTGAFDVIGLLGFANTDALIHWGQLLVEDSLNYYIELDNINTNDEILYADGGNHTDSHYISNSTIKINVKNASTKARAIAIGNFNLVNTKIIIEGNFEANNKCVSVVNNNLDANSAIIFKGNFKTNHSTLEAFEIGRNTGAGANNIIIDGTISTGGGYSIDNPDNAPISVIIKPGTSSNASTSANVTQLGSTITVDSNFNN